MTNFTHTGTVTQVKPFSGNFCHVKVHTNGTIGEYCVGLVEGRWPKHEERIVVWGLTDGNKHRTKGWRPA